MNLRTTAMCLTLTMPLVAGCPAFAQASVATKAIPKAVQAVPAVKPGSSFVPANFSVPTLVETASFKIVPLDPVLVNVDFDAYMSSIEHVQTTFTRSNDWPHKDISYADAMRDMEAEQARFKSRTSFAYAVLTPDGSRERGCVYVSSSPIDGYDAVVRMWVTKAEYDAGFDAELYEWVTHWIKTDWPFRNVAYPGRAIKWDAWDPMVAANTSKIAVP